jgi:5-methylcytosine-specific restriction protein A
MPQWPYNTPQWVHLRERKLRDNTLCEACFDANRLVPASVVDHKVPINRGGPAFPTLDGLTSMCWRCHNAKTQGERKGKTFIAKGCDAAGMPVDKSHPFYEGSTTALVASPHTQENKVLRPARSGTSMTVIVTSA